MIESLRRSRAPWAADYSGELGFDVPGECVTLPGGGFACALESWECVFRPGDDPPLTDDAYALWSFVQLGARVVQRRCQRCRRWRFEQELSLLRCRNRIGCRSSRERRGIFPLGRPTPLLRSRLFAERRRKSRKAESRLTRANCAGAREAVVA